MNSRSTSRRYAAGSSQNCDEASGSNAALFTNGESSEGERALARNTMSMSASGYRSCR